MKKVLDRKTTEPVELQVRSFKKTMKTRGMEIQTELLQPNITTEYLPYGSDMPYRIIVQNNPVNYTDPYGLWSVSLEGYYGGGGGFVFGKNPGGGYFLTFRYGYGIGGGVSYNPQGTSPGWDPCENYGPMNVGVGGYGGASVGLGPAYAGVSGNVGVNVGGAGHIQPYAGFGPEYGLDWGWSLRGGAAVGGEITFF